VPVYGDGLYVRDWLYVEDHAIAIDLIINKGREGETYCIGSNNDIPNIQVIKKIIHALGFEEDVIDYVTDRPGHDRRYAINAAKIKRELGWKSKYSFEEGLNLTIDWYKNNISWWKHLKNRDFDKYYKEQYVIRK
jgi:dTDP-glucose 4,6-dehydratase